MSTGNVAEIQAAGDAAENQAGDVADIQAAEDAENQAGNIAAARLTACSSYGRRRDSSLREMQSTGKEDPGGDVSNCLLKGEMQSTGEEDPAGDEGNGLMKSETQSTDAGDVANKLLKRKREIPSTGKEEELDLGIIRSLFSESRLFIGELQNQLERDRDCFLGLLRKSNEECENRFRDESSKLGELLLKYKASRVQALDDPFSKENEHLKELFEESRQAEESLLLSIAGKIDQIKEALEKRDQDEDVLAKMVVQAANFCPGFELRLPLQDDSKVTN